MSTLAMSMASSQPIHTFEGIDEIADLAEQNFKAALKTNIEIHRGNFDETLPHTLDKLAEIEFYFMDGNHYYEPTLRYFEMAVNSSNINTCIVFDDINWSVEMQKAWKKIIAHPKVELSLDLFFMGIVMLTPKYGTGHYHVLY
jgi:predicted O-methyltransferase YrrM